MWGNALARQPVIQCSGLATIIITIMGIMFTIISILSKLVLVQFAELLKREFLVVIFVVC